MSTLTMGANLKENFLFIVSVDLSIVFDRKDGVRYNCCWSHYWL